MSCTAATVTKSVIANISTAGHVLTSRCVKWSADNCIAILIDKHIYVLSSLTDPTEESVPQFPYHKSIIPNPDKPADFDCGLKLQKVLANSSLDEQQILMCDPALAGETSNSPTFLSYRQIDWSPICRQLGCLMAALTLDHRLFISRKDSNGWKVTTDLSVLLNQSLKKLWTVVKTQSYQTYRTRMFSLATNAFCWAQNWIQKTDSINCLIFLGSKNGLITFIDISIGPDMQINAELLYKWDSSMDQINCLKCFDDFLIISSINGTVCVISTQFSSDTSPKPLNLWSEADKIYVNDFAIKQLDDNQWDIVFAKSDFIIICRFCADTIDGQIQMSLKDCKSVIGLHQMPLTAICSIIGSKYLLSALDGRLVEIDITKEFVVTQSEVTIESVKSSSMCCHGVDRSPNGVLSVIVQSLTPFHDHLVVKEPVQVIVFTNLTFDCLTNNLIEKYLNRNPIQTNNGSIEDCFDYFDCIRSFLTNSQYSSPDSRLFKIVDDKDLISDCNDLLKLRVIRFITRTYISKYLKESADTDAYKRLESNVRLCEDLVLKLFIEKVFERVVTKLENLTESQLLSLKNMNTWYLKTCSQCLFSDSLINFASVEELCVICGQTIPFESKSSGRCPQSHRFNRCTNSLILCDFLKFKFEKCFRCQKSLVMSPSIWNQFSICLYCE